jgi:dihydropyrimidinase
MRTLIRGGTVVTATDTARADVLIQDEKVAAIGVDLTDGADTVIDATDRYVMPGGVDPHTHFDLPFGGSFCSDDFGTGTRAAAFGGTTTVVDFALQGTGEGLRKGLDLWHEKAQKACVDFGFHMIVKEVNEQVLREMDELVGEGVTSFKLFMAYPGVFMLDDASIFTAMQRAADSGALIMMHAENGGPIDVLVKQFVAQGKTDPVNHGLTRPASMEAEAVHRVFKLAELAGTPAYIVHLSSRDALDAVREARDRASPRSPRRAPSTCTCRRTTWPGPASRARSSSARRRCGRRTTRRTSGLGCDRATCRSWRPTTPPSTTSGRRTSARATSRRSRTACRASRIATRSSSRACTTAGSG